MVENELEEAEKTEQPQAEQDELNEKEKAEQAQDKKDDRIAWIRFIVLHVLVLIPIVIGVTCFIVGNRTNNNTLSFVGMLAFEVGVPVVMAILIAIVLTWKIRSIRKLESDTTDTTDTTNTTNTAVDKTDAIDEASGDEAKEQTPSKKEHEQNMIAAVNSTNRYASRTNMANYEMESIAEGMKHAPKWGLPVGLTCFFSLFALLITATVLLINRIFVGAIICAAIVGVVLITTFIVMAVSRAKATNGDISKAKKITEGKVKACFMAGTSTMRAGGSVRISGVAYRVIVIADGVEYGAFSNRFYETDEKVTVAVMGKKRAKIVDDDVMEKTEAEDNETE
ncbi:MAG: hypothetical protein K2K13_07395 [Clostridiales bacterium]|nr:hypothetical protein [Clostridiales bacterium]